jgi:hypothetical protein
MLLIYLEVHFFYNEYQLVYNLTKGHVNLQKSSGNPPIW